MTAILSRPQCVKPGDVIWNDREDLTRPRGLFVCPDYPNPSMDN